MKPTQLEGRMKAKKEEAIQLLKQEATYIEFDKEKGFIYEMTKAIYGTATRIVLALKNGHISVLKMDKCK